MKKTFTTHELKTWQKWAQLYFLINKRVRDSPDVVVIDDRKNQLHIIHPFLENRNMRIESSFMLPDKSQHKT